MLTSGWTLLIIAAVIAAVVFAYEHKPHPHPGPGPSPGPQPVAGLYPQEGKRIQAANNGYYLYAGTDGPANCISRVQSYQRGGMGVGGFDVGTGGDPGCHIYGAQMTPGNYSLNAEQGYTAYLPKASQAAPRPTRVMAP